VSHAEEDALEMSADHEHRPRQQSALDEGAMLDPVAVDDLDLRFQELRLRDATRASRLRTSIEREGIHQPILVSTGVEAGALVVVDGFKRVRVAQELELTHVPVRRVDLDGVNVKAVIVVANETRRPLSAVEEGLVVRSLHREDGLSQTAIGDLVGHHKTWVCRRLQLVERLAEGVQRDLRLGLLSAAVARALAALPRGNQARTAQVIAEHRLSGRETARLVRVLKVSSPAERDAVLADPLSHLATSGQGKRYTRDPRLDAIANQIREQLLRLEASSHRLMELLRAQAPAHLEEAPRVVLIELGTQVLPAARGAVRALEGLLLEGASPGGTDVGT